MEPKGRILIVDGEESARVALAKQLRDDGYQVELATDGVAALPLLDDFAPDVLLTDLQLPGMDGLQWLRERRALDPELAVVVMTGADGGPTTAILQGAADYLTKPIHGDQLGIVLARVLERRRLRAEVNLLRQRLAERHRLHAFVGSSPELGQLLELVRQIAPSRASVLITGESGTGKELVAAAIHQHSLRAAGPFVKLHCASLAESLLDAELFGCESGASAGTIEQRHGRLQQAHGGTLFLDEIAKISPLIQVKLLRFLQERVIERANGQQPIKLDVRVIAATNQKLEQLVSQGRFREDLYYRLNVVSLETPPLRARPGDIPLLAAHFLKRYCELNDKELQGLSEAARAELLRYDWPGNVRELENAIEHAVVVCRGPEIAPGDLPSAVVQARGTSNGMPRVPGASLAELERHAILKTLEHTGGSTSRAADILGISPRTIQYRLHEYRVAPGERRDRAGS